MKKTTRAILGSAVSIALCASLIAGSTFALFTSEDSVNIAVTSGKVDLKATATLENAWSAAWDNAAGDYGRTGEVDGVPALVAEEGTYTFTNTGTAKYDEETATLTLSNISPGDGVGFSVTLTNYSSIKTKYRVLVSTVKDNGLMAGLNFNYKFDGEELAFKGKTTPHTDWFELDAAADTEHGEEVGKIEIEIELPMSADNTFSSLEEDKEAALKISVYAVQQNGYVADPVDTVKVEADEGDNVQPGTFQSALDAVGPEEVLQIGGDIDIANSADLINLVKNAAIDFADHTVTVEDSSGNGRLKIGSRADEEIQVSMQNAKFVSKAIHGVATIENDADITFNNCEFISEIDPAKEHVVLEAGQDGGYRNVKLHFNHCKITNGYLNFQNATDVDVTFTDCEFVWDNTLTGGQATKTKFMYFNSTSVKGIVNITLDKCKINYNYWIRENLYTQSPLFSAGAVNFPEKSGQNLTVVMRDVTVTGSSDLETAPALFNFGATAGKATFTSEGTNTYTYKEEPLNWDDYIKRYHD